MEKTADFILSSFQIAQLSERTELEQSSTLSMRLVRVQNSVNSNKPASWSSDSEMSLILSWSLDNAHNYRETNQLINRKISHLSYNSLLLFFFFLLVDQQQLLSFLQDAVVVGQQLLFKCYLKTTEKKKTVCVLSHLLISGQNVLFKCFMVP